MGQNLELENPTLATERVANRELVQAADWSNHPLPSRSDAERQTRGEVNRGNLPGFEISGADRLPDALEAAETLRQLSPEKRVEYARDLWKRSFTENPRYHAVIEKVTGADGKEKEVLVDFDLVHTKADGRIDRKDLFNTTRGGSGQADRIQDVVDTTDPATEALYEMRRRFQKGNLLGSSENEVLTPPTKIEGYEYGLAADLEQQALRELKARGYDEEFQKDAKAALREQSGQHPLEMKLIDEELSKLASQSSKTADDKKYEKELKKIKDEKEKEQNDWQAKKAGLEFLD